MRLVTVKMSDIYVNGLDKLVENGMYPSRSEAIRVAVRDLLMRELWTDGMPLVDSVSTVKQGKPVALQSLSPQHTLGNQTIQR